MQILFHTIQIAIPFLWLGFVVGLSFIEAPLKFRAPGITRQLGLGIGRLVFSALNKIEITLGILLLIAYIVSMPTQLTLLILFALVAVVVVTQTWWIRPILDKRAVQVIQGEKLPPSSIHKIFVAMETTKVVLLLILGFTTTIIYLS